VFLKIIWGKLFGGGFDDGDFFGGEVVQLIHNFVDPVFAIINLVFELVPSPFTKDE